MTKEALAKANHIWKELDEHMDYLYARWLEESAFEDFAEYEAVVKTEVEKLGGKFVKMTKRPFAVTVEIDEHTIQIKLTQTEYVWKRVA